MIEDLDAEVEEAATSLGASRLQVVRRVILPYLYPAWLTGFALAFARAIGEYGSVVFISGNMPMRTEITPLLIITKLEQYDYAGRDGDRARDAADLVRAAARDQRAAGLERPAPGALTRLHDRPRRRASVPRRTRRELTEPRVVRWALTAVALAFLTLFLVLPLVAVFIAAFAKGIGAYVAAIREPDALSALRLTLLAAAIAVPCNLVFGVCAGWAIAKFDFPGQEPADDADRSAVRGLAGDLRHGVRAAVRPARRVRPVARRPRHPDRLRRARHRAGDDLRVVPVRRARDHSRDGGRRATTRRRRPRVLGASGLQTFFRVTLPNIKWGLLYGVILCNARAMGEFGAVSVVSGHIRGLTNTLPLQVEILYNEYNFQAAFAVASLLALLALVTLVAQDDRRATTLRISEPVAANPMAIEVQKRQQDASGSFVALEGRQLHRAGGRAGRAARPVGRRQDDAAADHRRARDGRLRHGAARGRGRHAIAARAIAASASCSSTTRCSAT